MYPRLNQLNMCMSYNATLRLMHDLSKLHDVPIQKWIKDGRVIKFWGDNVDKQMKVRDPRSDHQGDMLHMFSVVAGPSRTPAPDLPFVGQVADLTSVSSDLFLPTVSDVALVKDNLVVLVSRILIEYFPALSSFSKLVPKHIKQTRCAKSRRLLSWIFS